MVNTKIRLIIFFADIKQKQDQELTGSDHELLIAKYRLKLKKIWKTARPFRYDLHQIPYNYTYSGSKNIFKRLDLKHRVPKELCMEVQDIVQEAVIKTIPMKKKCKKAKWLPEKALQIAEKRFKRQKRKGKIHPFECRVSENNKERYESLPQ